MGMGSRHVAITGGIGSGKSFVCESLRKMGIRVYDCDAAAKRLMATDEALRERLCRLVGEEVYEGTVLRKKVLAGFLLASEANKLAVNDVVHPAVALDFERSGYQWLESAILFESGFHRRVRFDAVICVVAPVEERVSRIMRRDGISRERALEWIGAQMPQEEMATRSDYVVRNDGVTPVDGQLRALLCEIDKL